MCKNCVATRKKFVESAKTDDNTDTNTSTIDSSINESQNTSAKLSTTVISIPSDTSDYIKALSWGGTKWNWNYGDSNKLTYYFGTGATSADCPDGVTYLNGSAISTAEWSTAEKSAMRVGLLKWLKIIGMYETISDIEGAEVSNEANANLKFYLTTENVGYYGAQFGPHSNYPGVGIYVRYSGNTWTDSLDPGGFGFITIIHELGHAMGLAHPHDAGGGSGNFPGVTWNGDQGDNNLNQNMYTVMSYIDTNSGINPTNQTAYGFCTGPMAFDIATMKFLYGLNPSYNNTASTYTISDTNVNDTGYTTIYDTGNEDLIIYNGSKAVTIDLRPATITNSVGGGGYVSKVDDTSVYTGFTIAQDVQIENATGGSGDDNIYQVDTVENIITGNDGIDTVHYSGVYTDYVVTDVSSGSDGSHVTVTKNGITDNLYSIEKLEFSDGIVETNNITTPSAPSTEYTSYSSTPNLTINSSNLVLTDDIVITSNNQIVTNIDVVLDSILHTWVGDLKITLTDVNTGTSVILVNLAGSTSVGSSGDNFTNTVLSDSATNSINSIESGDSPHTGNYYPSDNTTRTYLSAFKGENINSTWRLTVEDTYPSLDDGSWVKWSLRFTPKEPEKTVTSTAITSVSNLFNSENLDSLVEGSSIYIGTNPSSTTTDDAMFNSSFGYESLKNLTTGSRNFSLGYGSLFNLTNGNSNVSIGIDSQSSNISGYGNLSFGNRSLKSNETTNVNIAIGENALSSLTNGNDNISIGYNSTKDAQNITNTINLGNNVTGNGSNTATIGNTGITKVYMNDNGDGEIYANGTINISDKNLKKNIAPTELGLDFINQLNPVSYEWKNKQNNKKSQGLIAQEVEETMNNLNMSKNEYSLVNYDESNNKYGINYSELIGPLIKAVQELSNENKELKEKISSLL